MRYWDASALVPLIVSGPASRLARSWLLEDDHIVTWAWTRTEITSAIERRTREGALTRANAVLARHPLRAADAGRLGAALLVSEQLADPLVFLCLDECLGEAAEREGLTVADTCD